MTPAVPSASPALVLASGGFTDLNLGLTIWTIVLFGAFAFVLSKFAWKPLLEVIEVRERTVREHVDKAEKAQTEAQSLVEDQRKLFQAAAREREEMLVKAVREAEQVRLDMVQKARQEAEHIVTTAREKILREKQLAILELRAQVADLAIEAAGKIVRSSLTPEVQKALVEEYIESLPSQLQ
jgi:F-type H+-transporting ATPase subunit b